MMDAKARREKFLKSQQSDMDKVLAWLAHINETDADCIAQVVEQCTVDAEARAFYISRYTQDCAA